jgi:hypothetical protein
MCCPEVQISPGDSIEEADRKVAAAFRQRGVAPLAFEHLNTLLPTSSICHFFQVDCEGRRHVAVVSSQPLEESALLAVLNILLNIRMDPDPPGPPPRFRFYSAYPVAPVLETLFGDSAASEFECRAALVVGYSADIDPDHCYHLAAVAVHLLRECLGLRTALEDPEGESVIAEAMGRWFTTSRFPEGGEPVNAIVTLGFLYGELVRVRLPYLSRWEIARDVSPWPVLVFGQPHQEGSEGRSPVVFNPVGSIVAIYQGSPVTSLREAIDLLARQCETSIAAIDEN